MATTTNSAGPLGITTAPGGLPFLLKVHVIWPIFFKENLTLIRNSENSYITNGYLVLGYYSANVKV